MAEDAVLAELADLRRQVAALSAAVGATRSVRLRTIGPAAFLGQPAAMAVSLSDAAGAPVTGASVTLAATWGHLRWVDGAEIHQGPSVTVRTGGDGAARVSLRPATAELLLDEQQAALAVALRLLDPNAPTPADVLPALQEIGRGYRWEAAAALRGAIDVYVRDFGRGIADSVNAWDVMAVWRTVEASVLAFVQGAPADGAPGSSVPGMGMLTVTFRDWLPPWLRAYEDLARSLSSLPQDLRDVRTLGGDAGRLIQGAYARARDYVRGEPGLVGARIGPRVARSALEEFVDGTADLPLATRLELHPAATAVTEAVGAGTVDAAGVVTQARTQLTRRLDASAAAVTGLTTLVATKADATEVASLRSTVDLKANAADLLSVQAAVDQKANAADLVTLRGQVAQKADATQLLELQGRFDGISNDVNSRINSISSRFDSINDRVIDIHRRLGGDG